MEIDVSEKIKRIDGVHAKSKKTNAAMLANSINNAKDVYLDMFLSNSYGEIKRFADSPDSIGLNTIQKFKNISEKYLKNEKRMKKNPKDKSLFNKGEQMMRELKVQTLILNSVIQLIHNDLSLMVIEFLRQVKKVNPKESLIDNINTYTNLFTIFEYENLLYLNKVRNMLAHSLSAARVILNDDISKDIIDFFENNIKIRRTLLLELIVNDIEDINTKNFIDSDEYNSLSDDDQVVACAVADSFLIFLKNKLVNRGE